MTPGACARQAEVLEAMGSSFDRLGTNGVHADLTRHLTECESCAELVTARLIADVYAGDLETISAPSAGQVWWRAQVRARAEARQAAERPMQIVHAVSAASVAGALAAGAGWAWPWIKQTAFWVQDSGPAALGFAWWLAIGAWMILAPVALYFVFARE